MGCSAWDRGHNGSFKKNKKNSIERGTNPFILYWEISISFLLFKVCISIGMTRCKRYFFLFRICCFAPAVRRLDTRHIRIISSYHRHNKTFVDYRNRRRLVLCAYCIIVTGMHGGGTFRKLLVSVLLLIISSRCAPAPKLFTTAVRRSIFSKFSIDLKWKRGTREKCL
jgi:hypothetical protein